MYINKKCPVCSGKILDIGKTVTDEAIRMIGYCEKCKNEFMMIYRVELVEIKKSI